MKPFYYPLVLLLISGAIGWLFARSGFYSSVDADANSVSSSPARSLRASEGPERKATGSSQNPNLIPAAMLEGLGTLKGSPRLAASYWFGDEENATDPGFSYLTEWLQLTDSQTTALAAIIRDAANDRKTWETANLHSVRVYQLTWIDHDPESLPPLR